MSDREIRFATPGEEEKIIEFLRDNWDPNFSVVQSRELFDFLYAGRHGPNFVLALREGNVVGTLGLSYYDETRTDVFLTLWRSVDTNPTTGIEMLKYVTNQNFDSISSVGTRKEVLVFYKLLKFNTGAMDQWVKISSQRGDFTILGNVVSDNIGKDASEALGSIAEVSEFSPDCCYFKNPCEGSPYKSLKYLTDRYLNHPVYSYRVFEYSLNGAIENYFVTRTVKHAGSSALRIVDCIANDLGLTAFARHLEELFSREHHEYADLYCLNMNEDDLRAGGFVRCSDVADVVVPNYFEPFLQEGEIKYYVTTLERPCLYKGDGDADRPYRLEHS